MTHPISKTAAFCVALVAGCGSSGPSGPSGPSAPGGPAFEVHEWGFVSVEADSPEDAHARWGTGPMQRAHGSEGKPVLYVHLHEGTSSADLAVQLRLPEGQFTEVWPPARLEQSQGASQLHWQMHASRDGCVDSYDYPRLAGAHCGQTADHYCEAAELHDYIDGDAACLTFGAVRTQALLYRADVRVPVPLVAAEVNGVLSVTNRSTHTLDGRIYLFERTGPGTPTTIAWTGAPAPGESVGFGDQTQTAGAAARALRLDLRNLGMTRNEGKAFMDAWEATLIGHERSRLGQQTPANLRPIDRALVYWLPKELVDEIAPLSISPAPVSVSRAIMMRVDLGERPSAATTSAADNADR